MANGRIAREQAYWGQQPGADELKEKYRGLQPWQIEARDPEAYKLLYEQEEMAPAGLADRNFATDFLGNLAWTFGEEISLGATLGYDIYKGGAPREAFGVQEWEDNSWAGRVGNIAGQGLGFIRFRRQPT